MGLLVIVARTGKIPKLRTILRPNLLISPMENRYLINDKFVLRPEF